jgi:hypothetical protein
MTRKEKAPTPTLEEALREKIADTSKPAFIRNHFARVLAAWEAEKAKDSQATQ